MNQTKNILFYALLGLMAIAIPVLAFLKLKMTEAKENETRNPNDCISMLSGQDLCLTISILNGFLFACLVGIVALVIFRMGTFKKDN